MTNLNSLRDTALRIATEHGFNESTIAEDFALIHSEVSEALEDHRAGEPVAKVWYEEKIQAYFADGTPMLDVNGKPIKVRFTWSRITASSAHWEQAFSPDGGTTWETNWRMDLARVE